jgi:hypothetical protein
MVVDEFPGCELRTLPAGDTGQHYRMLNPLTLSWRDELTLTREITVAGDRSEFYRLVHHGDFVALRRGVYMKAWRWAELDRDERYLARVRASVAFTEGLVVSHLSASAVWRLPWVGPYPSFVHAVCEDARSGGRRSSAIRLHALGAPDDFAEIDGVGVTSLARTVVDVARTSSFAQAVVVADAALRRSSIPLDGLPATFLTPDDLHREVGLVALTHGTAKALRAIEFADARADSPGESISRVNMSLARLTAPILQAPLRGASGKVWNVDFWWPTYNLIGEFDGKAKYTEEKYLKGRTPQQALYDEKMREDDLRSAHHNFTRWPWATATSMPLLRAHLIAAGLR